MLFVLDENQINTGLESEVNRIIFEKGISENKILKINKRGDIY
jgi:hypothetical protein